jgi:anti-sigma factor RsiW
MIDHPDFDELGDLADGLLAPGRATEMREHLEACGQCRATHGAIGRMAKDAAALPRDVAPPPELWNDVRARLTPRRSAPAVHLSLGYLAAASLLAALFGSGVTALLMRPRAEVPRATASVPRPDAHPALPATLTGAERGYAESAARLEAMLAERRDSLAPATVATVVRSLRIADSAIAEARAALARDPANRAIEAILASNYERKIDLLRRATELSPRT